MTTEELASSRLQVLPACYGRAAFAPSYTTDAKSDGACQRNLCSDCDSSVPRHRPLTAKRDVPPPSNYHVARWDLWKQLPP